MEDSFILLCILLFAHMLADFPLQGDYIAKFKNPEWYKERNWIEERWWYIMSAHCMIHAGFVGLITGIWQLGAVEFVWHFIIDLAKCKGKIGYMTDQTLHILCKVFYVIVIYSATSAGFIS